MGPHVGDPGVIVWTEEQDRYLVRHRRFEAAAGSLLLAAFLGLLCLLLTWGFVLRPHALGEADPSWLWVARTIAVVTGAFAIIGIAGAIWHFVDFTWIEVSLREPLARWGRRAIAHVLDPRRVREFTVGPQSDAKDWVPPPYHLLAILVDGSSRHVLETWQTTSLPRARALASRLNELLVAATR